MGEELALATWFEASEERITPVSLMKKERLPVRAIPVDCEGTFCTEYSAAAVDDFGVAL